jgi:hypothetical protein
MHVLDGTRAVAPAAGALEGTARRRSPACLLLVTCHQRSARPRAPAHRIASHRLDLDLDLAGLDWNPARRVATSTPPQLYLYVKLLPRCACAAYGVPPATICRGRLGDRPTVRYGSPAICTSHLLYIHFSRSCFICAKDMLFLRRWHNNCSYININIIINQRPSSI